MGEELVGAGAFRVDRERALKFLERYQLGDPEAFILEWCRCAVAGGATRIQIDGNGRDLEMRFDGRSFTAEELRNPYSPLMEDARPESGRNRDLAAGLLALWRLKPKEVRIVSGPPGARFALTADSAGKERVDPSPKKEDGTLLAACWPLSLIPILRPRWEILLRQGALRLCPIPVRLDGAELDRGMPKGEAYVFSASGVRGWLAFPCRRGAPIPEFQACKLGVRVGAIEFPLAIGPVSGWVNCDDFTLNASRSGIVEDAALEKVRAAVAAELPDFVRRILHHHRPRMSEAARSLVGKGSKGYPVAQTTLTSQWLQDAYLLLSQRPTAAPALKLLAAELRKAPVLFGAGGTALTIEMLRRMAESRGKIAYFASSGPLRGLNHVVLCLAPGDRDWLEECFPGRTRLAG